MVKIRRAFRSPSAFRLAEFRGRPPLFFGVSNASLMRRWLTFCKWGRRGLLPLLGVENAVSGDTDRVWLSVS